jgi:hypothetical protein
MIVEANRALRGQEEHGVIMLEFQGSQESVLQKLGPELSSKRTRVSILKGTLTGGSPHGGEGRLRHIARELGQAWTQKRLTAYRMLVVATEKLLHCQSERA